MNVKVLSICIANKIMHNVQIESGGEERNSKVLNAEYDSTALQKDLFLTANENMGKL